MKIVVFTGRGSVNMSREKISVIIPIYNSEKYLDRCIQSAVQQVYPNLEILLVDDGSVDSSGKLCDEWQEKDHRIRVIHKENGGLSDARNAGLDAATGDYIAFLDSDDYLAPDMLQNLFSAAKAADAKISICNFLYVDEDGRPLSWRNRTFPIRDEVISGLEAVDRTMMDEEKGWYYVTAWNKLYRKELFSDIRFPFGKIHEDEFIAHHLLGKCDRIACIRSVGYYYVQRPGSIIHSRNEMTNLHLSEAFLDRALYCACHDLTRSAGYAYLKSAVFLCDAFSGFDPGPEFQAEKKHVYLSVRNNRQLLQFCTPKEKLQIGIIFFNPLLYRLVFRNKLRRRIKTVLKGTGDEL